MPPFRGVSGWEEAIHLTLHSLVFAGGAVRLGGMRRFSILSGLFAAAVVGLATAGCATLFGPGRPALPPTPAQLANLEYRTGVLPEGRIPLRDGVARGMLADRRIVTFRLDERMVVGDLDRDGRPDAAVLLVAEPGAGATFVNLVAVTGAADGTFRYQADKFLGDGIRVTALTVLGDGRVRVETAPVPGPGPTRVQCYRLEFISRGFFRGSDWRLMPAAAPPASP